MNSSVSYVIGILEVQAILDYNCLQATASRQRNRSRRSPRVVVDAVQHANLHIEAVQTLRYLHQLSHEVLAEPGAIAAIHEHRTTVIDLGQLHGGTLHLGVGEAHLQVDVVDGLQEVAEVPTRRLDHLVVAKVTEEAHETAPEEHHEVVDGLASDCGKGGSQIGNQAVRVELVCIENGIFASGRLQSLLPHALAVLQLIGGEIRG